MVISSIKLSIIETFACNTCFLLNMCKLEKHCWNHYGRDVFQTSPRRPSGNRVNGFTRLDTSDSLNTLINLTLSSEKQVLDQTEGGVGLARYFQQAPVKALRMLFWAVIAMTISSSVCRNSSAHVRSSGIVCCFKLSSSPNFFWLPLCDSCVTTAPFLCVFMYVWIRPLWSLWMLSVPV